MIQSSIEVFNIEKIIFEFSIQGSISLIKPYGSGHINDTYFLKNQNSDYPDYLLQRINHHIFKDVPALMQNVQRVIDHLRSKLINDKEVMTIVPLKSGMLYHEDEQGNFWRMYHYLPNTKSYDLLENEHQAYEGGKAFGRFQALLADMDASLLQETIPNFHNIEMRLECFHQSLTEDAVGRKSEVGNEIAYIVEREEGMKKLLNLGKRGVLPLRITHNDTKFNNVLLDSNDKAQCVIDLDTVMPGYVAYDFGDAIRTIINTASEDEKDLNKIQLNIKLFEAYTKGYFEEAGTMLTSAEIESLIMGVLLFPYMQAVRFLTDYIDGDTYYKIAFEKHNLQRARAQLQLLLKMEEQEDALNEIIQEKAGYYLSKL
ncbi:phosphotransferase enzyme family protein [Solitalea koreensis]|uniref:Ser/Thr protein kinase RdoA involved in Cpx stress response, MazF antagonist n=1 Tax=Solitalea koreensis TaxID=543615 RepID=A0A521CXP9_9SPHI|nr:aminoglycoside phosphotransferase family protein [Solitalea koreensis]SMO64209.1 Ser/Thr protein kinase RdoA involved in Cpx stress response, MazF antagonist [Solitalea koreensis]